MTRFIRISSKTAAIVAVLVGVSLLLTPNRDAKALSFVGSGSILDSKVRVVGTSSSYWARISCDPEAVRQFIKSHRFPVYTPDTELPRELQDKFSEGFMEWPTNFRDYSQDWTKFEIGMGRFAIVAFNDKGTNEVLFITWSN
ncbi:hypothetical protein JIN85_11910 [Luteolibacter pohnpeiensis]|uniref:Uncharacterized protein n=1 Tax=Luteolibacter pohnpeiensis TaxID=454153 RepID=A0A934S944_9BACT|nr:hypothetical protein [Luteolibacter pohnpeiensis]MBK1883126.1 hypothetical protein [Luteolibacter pohnpeiensis]